MFNNLIQSVVTSPAGVFVLAMLCITVIAVVWISVSDAKSEHRADILRAIFGRGRERQKRNPDKDG